MTIVSATEKIIDKRRKKRDIVLQCDECNKIYNCEPRYKNRALKNELHFCGKQCSLKSFISGKLKIKSKKSLFDKYGSYYVETNKFKKEQQAICLSLYGVNSRLEAKEILDKIKITCLEKYGKETYTGTDDHASKINYIEIAQKAWKTKIKNGTCSKSNIEERVYKILCDSGIQVERQIYVLKQWVDFYIKSLNLYIQIDGVYWHGLNRPLNIIKLGQTEQDKKIYKQILRDEKLNQYMIDNQLRLLRITDEQINKISDNDILKTIMEF